MYRFTYGSISPRTSLSHTLHIPMTLLTKLDVGMITPIEPLVLSMLVSRGLMHHSLPVLQAGGWKWVGIFLRKVLTVLLQYHLSDALSYILLSQRTGWKPRWFSCTGGVS
ncbi:hypothetical protein EG68_04688 [Paragonimus skrjabini miyazakii]|uniref:Uncharacterized protein n=1 Tax=Paragonimus skrjabini miyazakii TaxID=59628 RepID=A0A8S9YTM1_9TREM|nr:hypothetical protein EG68_04688 [Paragonimus skrjabini miyazakii]